MTHTKGPWRIEVDDSAAQVAGYPNIISDDYTVVGTEGMFGDIETDYANAHLIAAAPELLDALRGAVDAMDAAGMSCHEERAAIAKAEGKA